MENFKLRPYQEEAIEAVKAARRRGIKRLLVCLPTGAGKTVVFARLAALAKRQVIVLAHREELIRQAEMIQGLPTGCPPELVASLLQGAWALLLRLTGEDRVEATLDEVFSGFCLGK